MANFFERLRHGWTAFRGRDRPDSYAYGISSYERPGRVHLQTGNDKTIINAIYNRIAVDVAAHKFEHVIVDVNGRYLETVKDSLNECLTLEANIDQTSRAFMQDVVLSMFDEGQVAIVPTEGNMRSGGSFDIYSLRTGKITQWFPKSVEVEIHNEETGRMERYVYPKELVGIVENPFYTVMNEPNSILKRLVRKLVLLDSIDEQAGSGKLDMIIQLPYQIKSDARREQAEQRRKDIEMQLSGSKFGIAYTDGTEKIMQLNRPLENNLMSQIEYLMNTLYSQLGITPEILNGTANEQVMRNYDTRTIEPILSAITGELKRKFLSKNARSRGHTIMFSEDPFRLVPINNIADIADRLTRNEILTPNEVRGIIGFKPNDDPNADELRNRNIAQANMGMQYESMPDEGYYDPNSFNEGSEAYPDNNAGYVSENFDEINQNGSS